MTKKRKATQKRKPKFKLIAVCYWYLANEKGF